MFKNHEKKPDYKSMTPEDLMKEGLLDYKQEVDILFDVRIIGEGSLFSIGSII